MMKTLFTLLICFTGLTTSFAQGYKITLETPSFKSGIAYLTYHMGKNLNIEDSAAINNQGLAVFKGNKTLPGGIYSVVFPGKNLTADFFIDKEQNIQVKADTADLQKNDRDGLERKSAFPAVSKICC